MAVTPLPTSGIPMNDLTEKTNPDGTEHLVMYDGVSAKSISVETVKDYTLGGLEFLDPNDDGRITINF